MASKERPAKVLVFASGRGSNFVNLVKQSKKFNYRVIALIVDNPEAPAIEAAKKLDIPYYVVMRQMDETKARHEEKIKSYLETIPFDYIALAGYMRILTSEFVKRYNKRVINIHPSLLPAFKGPSAIEDAFNYGVRVSGVTIHYIDEGIDTGEIIEQEIVYVDDDETLESFKRKIHELEHELYPKVIHRLIQKRR
ncbi:MAG TPA: phosphoribosylglycinamide formyltransferase [Aliicoccus persicus]|uniref:Phosphoribosylglycinamide formyltransferase n=1 Tax=Aliicoccus persicus TaxID=930138 RepID=A0A921DXU8_9STAP|nr:phosphoribosylglycinamide formyltransferase [Aliicoccus persicus]